METGARLRYASDPIDGLSVIWETENFGLSYEVKQLGSTPADKYGRRADVPRRRVAAPPRQRWIFRGEVAAPPRQRGG